METTKESQYEHCVRIRDEFGLAPLGLMANQAWHDDPRHLVFMLARYKFVAKMLSGQKNVVEVGCADAFGTRLVLQEVEKVTAVDFDPVFIDDVNSRMDTKWKIHGLVHDMLTGPIPPCDYDAAYTMDVIEHIQPKQEAKFVANIAASLKDDGILVVGSPSIHSQVYASPLSKAGHVNCKDAKGLRALMAAFFSNVFIFSMNDEVVHTGYYPMAQYLIALCVGKKKTLF